MPKLSQIAKTQYIDVPVVIRGQDPIPRGTTNHASIAQIVSTEIVAIARVQLLVKVVGTDGWWSARSPWFKI